MNLTQYSMESNITSQIKQYSNYDQSSK